MRRSSNLQVTMSTSDSVEIKPIRTESPAVVVVICSHVSLSCLGATVLVFCTLSTEYRNRVQPCNSTNALSSQFNSPRWSPLNTGSCCEVQSCGYKTGQSCSAQAGELKMARINKEKPNKRFLQFHKIGN